LVNSSAKTDLDTCRTFTSIEVARKQPKEVYILDLTKTKLTQFPEEILEMTNLHVLKLGKKQNYPGTRQHC
jgi:hypothetical protein